MTRVPKPLLNSRGVKLLVRLGLAASGLVFLLAVVSVILIHRNRQHESEARAIIDESMWAEQKGARSGLSAWPPPLKYNYDTDGSSEFVDHGWRHVEPPLHWNNGHPDEVGTNWNGVERVYDPAGTLRRESFILHSTKFGRTTFWDEHGRIAARGLFRDGDPVGRWLVWDDSVLPYIVDF